MCIYTNYCVITGKTATEFYPDYNIFDVDENVSRS